MEAISNTVLSRATILAAGAVYGSGKKQDFLLEGDFSTTSGGSNTVSTFKSLDGSVEGTLAQVLVEDIINLGTVDSIDFTSGTVAVTIKTTFKYA
jgi:vancomycin permeability regulator SanA